MRGRLEARKLRRGSQIVKLNLSGPLRALYNWRLTDR
jgi:hypothetical protein